MPWLVTGNCNHCGECCYKQPTGEMWDNPMMPAGSSETRCLFYEDAIDTGIKFGHCRVMKASQPKNARDIYDVKITQEQLDWYESNCPNFPNGGKFLIDMIKGKFTVPSSCAYTVTWVD